MAYRFQQNNNNTNKTCIEYVFIDKTNTLRSASKTLNFIPTNVTDVPALDLTSIDAPKSNSIRPQLYKPVAMYQDPFRLGTSKLVLCESPTRQACKDIMGHYASLEPWFGIEQEYVLFNPLTNKPLGWPSAAGDEPEQHGKYYCGIGAGKIFGRDVMEAHYRACLYAGLTLCGCNAEVTPSQLEYQIGPCLAESVGDELWMSRYILERIAEEFGCTVSLHARPISGNWNPSGCHTNFSTNEMRAKDGLSKIEEAIENMSTKHFEHIEVYGQDNHLRLTGEYETGHITVFSYGVGNRGASIRIPRKVALEGKGYAEDRRPAADIDPYQVVAIIMKSSFNYKSPFELQQLALLNQ